MWWCVPWRFLISACGPSEPMPMPTSVSRFTRTDVVPRTMAIALLSALGTYDTVLFSVHMVQHILLSMVAPVLMAASAPTALAIAEAEAAGITLVAVLRGADFELFTHPERFTGRKTAHVA